MKAWRHSKKVTVESNLRLWALRRRLALSYKRSKQVKGTSIGHCGPEILQPVNHNYRPTDHTTRGTTNLSLLFHFFGIICAPAFNQKHNLLALACLAFHKIKSMLIMPQDQIAWIASFLITFSKGEFFPMIPICILQLWHHVRAILICFFPSFDIRRMAWGLWCDWSC